MSLLASNGQGLVGFVPPIRQEAADLVHSGVSRNLCAVAGLTEDRVCLPGVS
ncbi:MAG: hypothetical protein NZ602_13855 [Thermoguttaceae bacterium]|nr:hypothetical protein [Thermoguttaceae bacterium]MDW8038748.1 hypothetical protein [Thermoguttaceae bacterium]